MYFIHKLYYSTLIPHSYFPSNNLEIEGLLTISLRQRKTGIGLARDLKSDTLYRKRGFASLTRIFARKQRHFVGFSDYNNNAHSCDRQVAVSNRIPAPRKCNVTRNPSSNLPATRTTYALSNISPEKKSTRTSNLTRSEISVASRETSLKLHRNRYSSRRIRSSKLRRGKKKKPSLTSNTLSRMTSSDNDEPVGIRFKSR